MTSPGAKNKRSLPCAAILASLVLVSGCAVLEQAKTDLVQAKDEFKAAMSSDPAPDAGTPSQAPRSSAAQAGTHSKAPASAPSGSPAKVARTDAQSALSEGIGLYDRGDFNGAIKQLAGARDIWTSDKATQTKALKYMAFSYCVTSRKVLCRKQFEKALKLDPAFDLAPGEKGHPLWTPVFERAKKSK